MAFTRDVVELVGEHADGALAIRPGWERRQLGEVCIIQNGAPFKSEFFNTDGAGLPLLRIRDVLRGETETWYSGPYDAAFVVASGDLVVGMDGDFNCALWEGGAALLNQRVCRLTPDPQLDIRFLRHLLPAYLKVVNDATPSVTVKHLSSKTLGALPVPVPPLDEQRAIVVAIDDALARIDAIEIELDAVHRGRETFRMAVLRDAFRGALVRPADVAAPGDQLPSGGGVSDEALPNHWRSKTLGELVEQIKTKRHPRDTPDDPYIGMDDIEAHTMRRVGRSVCAKYKSLGNGYEPGLVMYGRLRPYLNKVYVPDESGVCSGEFILMRPGEEIDLGYLARALNSPAMVTFAGTLDAGDRPRVSFEQIRAFQVALPPIGEQRAIVAAIADVFERIDALDALASEAAKSLANLRASVLHRAFTGELLDTPVSEKESIAA